MESQEIRKDGVAERRDKENEIVAKMRENKKSSPQGNEIVFNAGLEKTNNWAQDGRRDRRMGVNKPMDKSGPRNRYGKQNRPGQGLLFGPTRKEQELSASGKRLRVENENMGRSGGVFMIEPRAEVEQQSPETVGGEVDEALQLRLQVEVAQTTESQQMVAESLVIQSEINRA